jgi:hypothetical protein
MIVLESLRKNVSRPGVMRRRLANSCRWCNPQGMEVRRWL